VYNTSSTTTVLSHLVGDTKMESYARGKHTHKENERKKEKHKTKLVKKRHATRSIFSSSMGPIPLYSNPIPIRNLLIFLYSPTQNAYDHRNTNHGLHTKTLKIRFLLRSPFLEPSKSNERVQSRRFRRRRRHRPTVRIAHEDEPLSDGTSLVRHREPPESPRTSRTSTPRRK